jgi:hypothetical protein
MTPTRREFLAALGVVPFVRGLFPEGMIRTEEITEHSVAAEVVLPEGVETLSSSMSLGPGEIAMVQIQAEGMNPNDDVEINLYGSLDGETFDEIPILMYRMHEQNGRVSFNVDRVPAFRVGFKPSSSGIDTRVKVRRESVEAGGRSVWGPVEDLSGGDS